MDRDVALGINTGLNNLKTALQSLVTNTAPSNANRSISDMRSAPDPENREQLAEEPELEPEQEPDPEPEPQTNTRKK